jgi:putative SOS response-associated peptidase YedK
MCGRFGYTLITLKDGTQKWIRLVQEIPNVDVTKLDSLFRTLAGSENHPGGTAPILYYVDGSYQITSAVWGFKPDWSPKVIFNTRAEKLFQSSFWGESIFSKRCIVPASYFLEWKSELGTKVRYRIENRDHDNFCFAGIWGHDTQSEKPWFTILTQEGNSLMKEIHNTGGNQGRQPVQITADNLESWLSPQVNTQSQIQKLITNYSSESITATAELDQPSLF